MISVIIADDQILFRESLSYMLQQDSQINVVGGASNGLETIELCETYKPDIILMDINMPKMDGIEATKIIKNKNSKIKIIMLTTYEDKQDILDAFINKVDGYIVKDVTPEDLIMTVKGVYNQFFIIHKKMMNVLMENYILTTNNKIKQSEKKYDLTESEVNIIQLIAEGNSNKQIAQELSFSEGTIKNKVSQILSKIQLKDRTQLVVFALKNNII